MDTHNMHTRVLYAGVPHPIPHMHTFHTHLQVIHNGSELAAGKSTALSHNDRLRLGSYSTFRVVIPSQVCYEVLALGCGKRKVRG